MTTTVDSLLRAAISELRAAGIEGATGDARRLTAFALGIETDRLTLSLRDAVEPDAIGRLDAALAARLKRKPVSHIIGTRLFWGRDFRVTPAVLDPRPETETLVEVALRCDFQRVLDLGTGSGCILLTLLAERKGATGMGVDASEDALKIAVENRAALGLERAAIFTVSDWFSRVVGQFDLIVANPPYISLLEMAGLAPEVSRWEPMAALTPGVSGLEAYAEIAAGISEYLTPKGKVLLEIGPTQAKDVVRLFESAGMELVAVQKDMDGRDRVIELQNRG